LTSALQNLLITLAPSNVDTCRFRISVSVPLLISYICTPCVVWNDGNGSQSTRHSVNSSQARFLTESSRHKRALYKAKLCRKAGEASNGYGYTASFAAAAIFQDTLWSDHKNWG